MDFQVSELCQQVSTNTPVLRIEKMGEPVISLCSLYANRKAIAHVSHKKGYLTIFEHQFSF